MNQNQLQTVMEGIFGIAGANITGLTTQLQNAAGANQPRELTLVKVDPFYGRDDEDPHEWIDLFNQAAVANRWAAGRKMAIAAGYLKEAAHDWYEADKANIVQWHIDGANNNFDDRFINYFSPETKQNKWYYELMTIRQTAGETVDQYSRRFSKLLRKCNNNNLVPAAL